MFVGGIVLVYFVGWFVAACVLRIRAGVGIMHRLKVFGPDGFGLGWTLHSGIKATFWPITLGLWLANGRPEPTVVFNEKAVQRQMSQNLRDARM